MSARRRLFRLAAGAGFAVLLVVAMLATAFVATPGDPAVGVMGVRGAGVHDAGARGGAASDDRMGEGTFERLAWLARRLVAGDFAVSMHYDGVPVVEIVRDGLPATVLLCSAALAVAAPIGVFCGMIAASARGAAASAATIVVTVFISLPSAGLATVLIYLLAQTWRLTPVSGWDGWSGLVSPALTLALPAAGFIARVTAGLARGVLPSPHVRTARAKGASVARVLALHVLWNIAPPLAAQLGAVFSFLLSGSVLVEVLFAVPGLGREATTAIAARDYPVLAGCVVALILVNVAIRGLFELIGRFASPVDDPGPDAAETT